MDSIDIINKVKNLDLKEYKKLFKDILKETKNVLEIDNKISLSLTICLDDYIRELNKEYRNIDKETDVLSFAIEDGIEEDDILDMIDLTGAREIGDIIINYNRVLSQSEEYKHSIKREFCFLFTHGLLHLLGYDHMEEDEEKEMFELQEKILSNLGIHR